MAAATITSADMEEPTALEEALRNATPQGFTLSREHVLAFFLRYTKRADGPNACWIFIGHDDNVQVNVAGEWVTMPAMRFVFLATHKHLEDSLVISRGCGTPGCVRPEHLRSGGLGEFLTVRDVAALLQSTTYAVGRACRNGQLPGVYLSRRTGWRIPRAALASWHIGLTHSVGQKDT